MADAPNPLDEIDPQAIDEMMERGYKKATKRDFQRLAVYWRQRRDAYKADQEKKLR